MIAHAPRIIRAAQKSTIEKVQDLLNMLESDEDGETDDI